MSESIILTRLAALRARMEAHGGDACFLPTSDPHISEYVPAHYASRAHFSGFTGSAGTLCVTRTEAALWADGRYYVQAAHQIEGTGIVLQRMGEPATPKPGEWLRERVPESGTVLADGFTAPESSCEELEKLLGGARVVSAPVVDEAWTDGRPALPRTKAWLLDVKYAGRSAAEKLGDVREALTKEGATALAVTKLDSAAWLTNLRADDLPNTPFALSFCLVTKDSAALYIDASRLEAGAAGALRAEGFAVEPYDAFEAALKALSGETVLVEKAALSRALYQALAENPGVTLKEGRDPIQLLKAVKNETELACLRAVHIRDGMATARYLHEVSQRVAAGETLTEWDASEIVNANRCADPMSLGISFTTIAAYGANAAMMHYAPAPDTAAALEPHGFLLTDCGGQYYDGTTDITRTIALGPVTDEERRWYTLTLKSHIALARAVFPEGTTGTQLDTIPRSVLWAEGLDYRCGTGHGVGFVGGVHEGPPRLSHTGASEPVREHMLVTDEPGVYEEGVAGIRIENEIECRVWGDTEYGRYLCFEPLTMCPIDTKPVDVTLLSDAELDWLNAYHARVLENLSPLCRDDGERAWLAEMCAEVRR